MGTCRSSAYVASPSRPEDVTDETSSESPSKASKFNEDLFVPAQQFTESEKIMGTTTFSMSTDWSVKDSARCFSPRVLSQDELNNITESDKKNDESDQFMEAILEGMPNYQMPLCEHLLTSPESNFIVDDDNYSKDRDNEVITVVSQSGPKSVVTFSKLSLSVSEDRSHCKSPYSLSPKELDKRSEDDDSDYASNVISNISSLTSASPGPSPVPSKSFSLDPDDYIEFPRVEKNFDLRKSRSLFGNSLNSLASQLSPPVKSPSKVLPVDGPTYENDELDHPIDW